MNKNLVLAGFLGIALLSGVTAFANDVATSVATRFSNEVATGFAITVASIGRSFAGGRCQQFVFKPDVISIGGAAVYP